MASEPNWHPPEARGEGSNSEAKNESYAADSSVANQELGPPQKVSYQSANPVSLHMAISPVEYSNNTSPGASSFNGPIPAIGGISSHSELEQSDSRHCVNKDQFEEVEGSLRQASEQSQKEVFESHAQTHDSRLMDDRYPAYFNSYIQEHTSADTQDNELLLKKRFEINTWADFLAAEQLHEDFMFPRQITPPLEQDLGRALRSKEPGTLNEKPSRLSSSRRRRLDSISSPSKPPSRLKGEDSRATSKRRGRDIHTLSFERGKGAKVTRLTNSCESCRIKPFKCYHRNQPTSNADDVMDTFIQASNNSNTTLQKGQSKSSQCSEDEAANCLDPQQPEIGTKSRDEVTSESAADLGYPEQSLAGHARDQLTSALDSRESLLANQDSEGPEHSSGDCDQGSLLPSLRGQSERMEAQQTQGSSDLLANAGDHECLTPKSVMTKTEREEYVEDLMQSIRSRVLRAWETQPPSWLKLTLFIPCNVRNFMEKQFAGSNEDLGRVITLSGTATCGQATTCSDYVSSNWPLRGLWILDTLQDAFGSFKGYAKGCNFSDLQIYELAITTTPLITVDFIGSKEAAIDVVQLLVWFGAAFQVSSSDQIQYSQSKLHIVEQKDRHYSTYLTVDYEKSPVHVESCWFSLFNNPVIAQGFPVPGRSNCERGLELPIELMATLGGGRHAVDFEGGLVIKGTSIAFVPVKQYEDTIQWHMVSNSDGTRLRYNDLKMYRALQNEVDYESIRAKRTILGWSQIAQSFLGTAGLNYEGIDWSEAKEAGRSTRLSGGGLGFQSNLIGQLNFALGAKDGRLLLSQNGPLEKIIGLAENTPVALYDHHDRRAWLVPALEVILHVIHTRASLNMYKLDRSKTKISYSDRAAKISDQAARRAIIASKDQQLYEGTSPGEKAYYVQDAALDIWSLLERMMERDAVITSAPGVAVRGTMRDKLYGWEFRALVEDKNSFRQKEQVLGKSNGGWVDLVDDTDTMVLFGNGFGEIIKPVRDSVDLCSAWKVLPKGRDYLAVGCPMLETLYNEAGSRKTRSYLTSRHLQWHRGSTLFEKCEETSGCACDRLQQLVYDSRTTFRRVKPPDELPENGCVIFGRAYHPIFPARGTCAKKRTIYSMPNGPLPEAKPTEPKSPAHLPTTSLEFRPVRNEIPDRNDLSSMFDMSSSTTDSQSESELRMLSLKKRRKIREQDACERDSLNGRQKKHSPRRSSLQVALKSTKKIISNRKSNLENKGNNEARSFPPDDKDPLGQAPGRPCGKGTFDDYIHWQSQPTLDTDSGD